MKDILIALSKLDPKNDEQWTSDGQPLMAALGGTWTRKEVTSAAPLFTRDNPTLAPIPKELEVPPAPPPPPKTAFEMKSSEFGGGEDDEEDQVYVPPSEEAVAGLKAAAAESAAILAEKLAKASAATADALRATQEHDALLVQVAIETAIPEHVRQQNALMSFLNSGQKHKTVVEKAQIDKVMERKDGYGRKRPVFFNKK